MISSGEVNNRPGVAQSLRMALERVNDEKVPIDQQDPAYWRWVFGDLRDVMALMIGGNR